MLNRRDLLRAAASAGALGAAWPLSAQLSPASALAAAQDLGVSYDPAPFTLGVASGDPLPDSVVLWTRLARSRWR
ncbi:PhoD-like phosphatase N-terminal domain-containing protein [Lentzea tibetensis]|uniref:PhoD-like phosphatase N-terminal domain-containing protein n=1 Tax=Lentzea tibetensis TaxID=2591470 RepID=UPI001F2BE240|nr:PhoD-like phosphatase N-terminal domain-containing protein [Lentzea tibetensis]